ncbi:MAG: hypothetical protein IPI11_16220 [Haliscomenobacter sp.]|nr:hypothetical protein [Haliscomenobacter sp.]
MRSRIIPVFETELWCVTGHFNSDQALKYKELMEKFKPEYILEIGFVQVDLPCLFYIIVIILKNDFLDKDLDWKAPHGRRMEKLLMSSLIISRLLKMILKWFLLLNL